MSDQPAQLEALLAELPADEIVEFERIFTDLHYRAYTWGSGPLRTSSRVAAATTASPTFESGSSASGATRTRRPFAIRRRSRRSRGRGVDLSHEEFLSVAANAYQVATGEGLPFEYPPHPAVPSGTQRDEGERSGLYPEPAARFGSP